MLASEASGHRRENSVTLPEMPPELKIKADSAIKELRSFGRVLVAFSGGIDSTLVAYLAKLALGPHVIAVTANSPSLPSAELEDARSLAKELGIEHVVVRTEELDDPNYVSNPANRCYFCKKELSGKLKELAAQLSFESIVDGTNADDLRGHRPGASALSEAGVKRPLADVGMTKEEVRELSRLLGLRNHDKPSMPCLSSRVQYGQLITTERLLKIERAETLIRSLTMVKELRVRDHGDIARIEVGRDERHLFFNEELLDRIAESMRELGFTYIAIDLLGYRSGSMNKPSER